MQEFKADAKALKELEADMCTTTKYEQLANKVENGLNDALNSAEIGVKQLKTYKANNDATMERLDSLMDELNKRQELTSQKLSKSDK